MPEQCHIASTTNPSENLQASLPRLKVSNISEDFHRMTGYLMSLGVLGKMRV